MRNGIGIVARIFLSSQALLRLALLALAVFIISQFGVAAARAAESGIRSVSALRIWPAAEYTRLTIESRHPVVHTLMLVKDPERLVVDIENVEFASVQRELAGKLSPDDPYIATIRAGRFKPGVVRLVLDLKQEVNPQSFALPPVGDYGHRLVLDVYPLVAPDPLMALAQKNVVDAPGTKAAPDASRQEAVPPQAALPPRDAAATAAKRSPVKVPVGRMLTIAVDAGHGGEDPGARGHRGTHEKMVTLMIARKLKEAIDAEPGMRAVLIRDGDYFVPLQARVEKARRVKADLFVSIHADAFVKPHARGSSVFALSERGATSAAARWLAKRENDADLIGGVNIDIKDRHLAQTLLDLSQTATIQDSLKLGRAVLREIGGINTLHKEQVEQAGFAVLKAPDIPSILVETAFISNPEEEMRLSSSAYQQKLAQAIMRGVRNHFARNPPPAPAVIASAPSQVNSP